MKVRLEVAHSKANVRRVVLTRDAVIGRSPDCNLRIAAGQVSRRHCTMRVSDRGVFVQDHGSSNGTFLGDRRLEPHVDVPVPPGSKLSIGGVRFHVRYELAGMVGNVDGSTVHRSVGDTLEPGPSPVADVGLDEGADTADVTATKGPSPARLSDDEPTLADEPVPSDLFDGGELPVFDFEDDDIAEAEPEEPTVDVPVVTDGASVADSPSDFAVDEDAPADDRDDVEFLRKLF